MNQTERANIILRKKTLTIRKQNEDIENLKEQNLKLHAQIKNLTENNLNQNNEIQELTKLKESLEKEIQKLIKETKKTSTRRTKNDKSSDTE